MISSVVEVCYKSKGHKLGIDGKSEAGDNFQIASASLDVLTNICPIQHFSTNFLVCFCRCFVCISQLQI